MNGLLHEFEFIEAADHYRLQGLLLRIISLDSGQQFNAGHPGHRHIGNQYIH
ncbi:hypothetical protein D3C86_2190590 [compost metagenome]